MILYFSCCLQVDLLYVQSLRGVADIHENGVTAETFDQVGIAYLL